MLVNDIQMSIDNCGSKLKSQEVKKFVSEKVLYHFKYFISMISFQ